MVGTQMLSKGSTSKTFGSSESWRPTPVELPRLPVARTGISTHGASRGAAREHGKTRVIIQSNDPGQPIYTFIREGDIEGFYHLQLQERKLFNYPPFGRLIRIIFKHKSESIADAAASRFAQRVKRALHERVLGPNIPVVNRVQQHHIREVLLKLENELPLQPVRDLLKKTEEELRADQRFRYVTLYYDVDPV